MRIAWVSYDFEEYSVLHANALAAEHDVLLLLPHSEQGSPAIGISDKVISYPFRKPRLRQPLKQLASLRELYRVIKNFSPDVVHFQQGHLWFNSLLPSIRKVFPLVITIHDPRHHAGDAVSKKTPQWVMDFGFRRADHVIVHGEILAEQVQELFGLRPAQVHVIPHVIMGQTSHSVKAEEPTSILFFGRIWDYKGLDHLINAVPQIAKLVPKIKVIIAGTGESFGKYERLIENKQHFEIHNRWISDEERAEFFNEQPL